jgi:hypothetical protein
MSPEPTFERQMIEDLLLRKAAYEALFREQEKEIDHKAESAYASLVKTIVELSIKAGTRAKDPEELKRIADEILENDYGIKRR